MNLFRKEVFQSKTDERGSRTRPYSSTDAVRSRPGSARRRRDDNNPPKCVGGHFKQATDTFVGTRWPSASAPTASQRTRAFLPKSAAMKCGNTASGDRNHQGRTRPLEFPDRHCIVNFLEA
ncbi:unnamed protein product [Colias eurytheme]|nr:unnamed protein product [Colias eurytheme]